MIVYTIGEPPENPRYKVTGVYAHYCLDWDGLAVSEFTPEFGCCLETWSGWRGWLLPVVKWLNNLYWNWRIK